MTRFGLRMGLLMGVLGSWPGTAAALEVAPVLLNLQRERPVSVLTVRNPQAVAVSLELTGFAWRQEGGEDHYTEDSRLIITPPLLHLAPGESRTVRVGLLETEGFGQKETAFRLLLRDITAPLSPQSGLRLRLQMLLPVFLEAGGEHQDFALAAYRDAEAGLCVSGRNDGLAHEKLVFLERPETGDQVSALKYFLPGTESAHCAEMPFAVRAGMKLRAALASAEGGVRWKTLVVRDAPPVSPQR
ncbi:fimbrial biogenesis chaperone [Tepidicaulis sp. LMO-SS28]|uniref:fimbrial biogenesis chaperone n=1 Tax=Tepidicaulis sp. LMO-SS28 TaxID=3447455 RepID=UPI003EE06BAF